MEFKFHFILLILLFFSKKICSENNFEFKLVNENMKKGTYISSTISENGYLYIVTGPDEVFPGEPVRYLMRMNLDTLSLNYYRDYPIYNMNKGFSKVDSYSFSSKGYYLFNIGQGWYENVNLQREDLCTSTGKELEILNGNRGKMFKKLGSFYYFIFISQNDHLIVLKMRIKDYHEECDVPNFEFISHDIKILVNNDKDMISCDSTRDNNYILCAYPDKYNYVNLVFYNTEPRIEVNYQYPDLIESFHFIKLLYMKDDSNFILMYSINEKTTRLRYFKNKKHYTEDKLGSIIRSTNTYLDIFDSQNHGYSGSNDIVISGTDKVIKVYGDATSNIIIITIIQFYENDSYMTVKIYNMKNGNGFNYFQQSRISMARDSIVFCASAEKNNIRRPGYSLINYPYVADKILRSSNISVKDLDLKLDTIFHVTPKLKILNIPFPIVIRNNSKIIKNGDELELNDVLTILLYRTNESNFIIEYQAIARGNDSGYEYIKKYPANREIKDYNDIFIEGRKGQMTVDIKNCLDGFYPKEDDINLCSALLFSGYYFDIKNKIWRICPFPCGDCGAPINSTHKNCSNCLVDYFLTEDTKYCYKETLENYYIDGDTLRRCHKNCLYCSTGSKNDTNMKCTKCYPNWYMTVDTNSCYDKIIENYYIDGDTLRRCHKNCLFCSTGSKNDTNMKCIKCYPNFYMTEDTDSCYNKVIENYYLDGDTLRRCHKNCLYCSTGSKNDTNMKCIKCYSNWYLTEDTNSCYDKVIENYYIDGDTLRRCHKNCLYCSTGSKNDTNMKCTKCYPNWYMTVDTNSCYDKIIENYYIDGDTLRRCHKNCLFCSTGSKNDTNMKCIKCYPNFYMTEDTDSCYNKVIENYYLDGDTLRRCHKNCLYCSTKGTNYTHMNCLKCYDKWYLTEDTMSCYSDIIDNYYLYNKTNLKRCHKNCLHCITNEYDNNYMNCTKCFENFYMTEDTNSCYDKVIDNYYLDNTILRRCHKNCLKCSKKETNSTYMNCLKCQNNFYMTEDTNSCYNEEINNYYKDNNTLRRCHPNCLKCSIGSKNNNYMNCTKCQNNFYMTEDTKSCYDNVIDNYYKENYTLRRCHENCLRCSTGSKNNTYMNCTKCIKNFFMTEDTSSCYDYIPNNYYLDNSTSQLRRCFSRCTNCIGAKNNITQNCLGCSNDTYYYKKDTFDCILKEEITKGETKEFSNKDSKYFYIFIGIFIAAILIFIIICVFYKVKEKKEKKEQKEENNEQNNKTKDYISLQNKSDEESSNDPNIIND